MSNDFNLVTLKVELAKYLNDNFKHLGKPQFSISEVGDALTVMYNLALQNIGDNISVQLNIYTSGGCQFDAIFDTIPINEYTLKLINQLNISNFYFKAYIDEANDYFVLNNSFLCNDIINLELNIGSFLFALATLTESEIFQQLTLITR